MKKLHPTQQRLLELLKRKLGEPLTIRELQSTLDISSPSLIHFHVQQLEKKGFIKRNPANPADFQVLFDTDNQVCYLNLYGMAKCGPNGTILDGSPVDRIPISTRLLGFPPQDGYLLQARGDSMEPRIPGGAIVIIKKCQYADFDSVVACSYRGEAYIKKLIKEDNSIKLHSFNPAYQDMIVEPETLIIEGVVKGVLSFTI